MDRRVMREFRRDPLDFLETLARSTPASVFPVPWGGQCVNDTRLAEQVLRSPEFHQGPSPFFGRQVPARADQAALGRALREALRRRLPEYQAALTAAVQHLPEVSAWPVAGVLLIHRSVVRLLVDDAPPELRWLMERAVRGVVLFRAPTVPQRAWSELRRLRPRLLAAVTRHVAARRTSGARPGVAPDVVDVLIESCPPGTLDRTITRLFEMMFRSVVGTVGYSLAWTVLLASNRRRLDSPWSADWVVRESLRHRPIVWMVGRRTTRAGDYGGMELSSGEVLSVSPYLLHHDPERWAHPHLFDPERWGEDAAPGPYAPFGAGPFVCAGASIAQRLIVEGFTCLRDGTELVVSHDDLRPTVTSIMMPRPFILRRIPRAQSHS